MNQMTYYFEPLKVLLFITLQGIIFKVGYYSISYFFNRSNFIFISSVASRISNSTTIKKIMYLFNKIKISLVEGY